MIDRSPFELALDDAVSADDPIVVAAARQVYADWLDENGDDEDAAWQRELAVTNKYPSKLVNWFGWFYTPKDQYQNGTDILPIHQWDRLTNYANLLWVNTHFKGWSSRQLAEDALRRVLHHEWQPPTVKRKQVRQ